MADTDITETIQTICDATLGYTDLRPDEDFFDRGATSLTIVELQIRVEEELQLQVPTSKLMAAPSVNGWAEAYRAVADTREYAGVQSRLGEER
jgi:D-alanine--poly(phosphoribitol) ligase subunit 2